MERRRERRGILDQSVQVTLLKSPDDRFKAQTIDRSGRGMRLLVPHELPPGTTLKIETDDTLLLAEVCYCNPVNSERFAVGVEVSQSLQLTPQLRKLAEAVAAGANTPRTVAR
jgi:PilZ domain